MHIDVLTLFPEMFASPLSHSIVKRALEKAKLSIELIDFRKFCTDKHKQVDDYPFGGAPGMVIKPEPIFRAVDYLKEERKNILGHKPFPLVYLTPQGETYSQQIAKEFSEMDYLALLCGHYKDVDYRVREHLVMKEISIGNYVLSGGELPAMVIIDTVARLQQGVLTNIESAYSDSFQTDSLDGPYYTRPREYRGYSVPDVLISGNHKKIEEWQQKKRNEFTERMKK
ncbi:MAG TPA: tRNA (guanosine(37)-N1)-methyltransferase TrmD [Candidatus Cloacimonetes bacterium]|nr:tRNA (guanosine(37)-N1)-methyltransferase TrmD [Candidatus Cloacimonadota bacterium]HEX37798.1 tRNA (guanosine(37)-N1)-methyltransferase TrmD [Candidatus Cloacimonadota bacterium]